MEGGPAVQLHYVHLVDSGKGCYLMSEQLNGTSFRSMLSLYRQLLRLYAGFPSFLVQKVQLWLGIGWENCQWNHSFELQMDIESSPALLCALQDKICVFVPFILIGYLNVVFPGYSQLTNHNCICFPWSYNQVRSQINKGYLLWEHQLSFKVNQQQPVICSSENSSPRLYCWCQHGIHFFKKINELHMGCRCKASLACLTAHVMALSISRSTWSCLHLYMPPASGMAQPLRMCSAVPRSWHHTHLSSSERFHSLRFVGHGNTLYVDWMRNFTIKAPWTTAHSMTVALLLWFPILSMFPVAQDQLLWFGRPIPG